MASFFSSIGALAAGSATQVAASANTLAAAAASANGSPIVPQGVIDAANAANAANAQAAATTATTAATATVTATTPAATAAANAAKAKADAAAAATPAVLSAVKSSFVTAATGTRDAALTVKDETLALFDTLFGSGAAGSLDPLPSGLIGDYVNAIMTLNIWEHFKKNINNDSAEYAEFITLFTPHLASSAQPSDYVYFDTYNKIEDYTNILFTLPPTMPLTDQKAILATIASRLKKINSFLYSIKSHHASKIYEAYMMTSFYFLIPGLILLIMLIAFAGYKASQLYVYVKNYLWPAE